MLSYYTEHILYNFFKAIVSYIENALLLYY